MNILLTAINAKYIHSNLAVYSLKASAGRYEPMTELAEFTVNNQPDDIFRAVYRKKPDLLFLSCYIWNRNEVIHLAENIRKVLPGTVIWAGGPEVSHEAEEFLRMHPQFTGVMVGEGERTFFYLLQHYVEALLPLKKIPGIVYRERGGSREACAAPQDAAGTGDCIVPENGACGEVCLPRECEEQIYSTGQPEPVMTLDGLPFVYQVPEKFEHRIIYYESSRGCPYSCSYCLSSIDKRVRFRSPEIVKRELLFLLEHKVPQVKFVDRTFNCNHRHALEIWKFIQEHDNGITNFHFEIAADILTDEELEVLAGMRPGLVQLEIGVQTVNAQTLEAIHRTAEFRRITDRVLRIAEGRNIHQHLDLIAGLPYEDFESFQSSFDAVYALKPQELQLGFLKVLRGSEMYRRAQEYGIVYRSEPPYEVLSTRWISCDELLRLKEVEEMLEVYYNSRQFRYTIEALEKLFERPFALYEALAEHCGVHEEEGRSYSRMQRFLILREFIRETVCARENAAGAGDVPGAAPDGEKILGGEAASDGETTPGGEAASGGETISGGAITPGGETISGGKAASGGAMTSDGETMPDAQKGLQRFDELLTLDIYLRENAKSRPVWAEDLAVYRGRIIRFYQREEQLHTYLPEYSGMSWKQIMRMTHLEHFTYDVLTDGKRKETWLLFDYEKRDPLTNDAAVREIKLEE